MALTRLSSTRDFLKVCFYWKYHALFIFFIIIILVMVYTIMAQPIYEAKAKILILPTTTEGQIISTGSEIERIQKVSREDINTEIELLNSEDVIRDTVTNLMKQGKDIGIKTTKEAWYNLFINYFKSAINRLLLYLNLREPLSDIDANVKRLKAALKFEPVAMSNIIIIKLGSEKQKGAAILLNQLLDTYIKHHNEVFSKDDSIYFFNDQANEYQKELEQTEKQLTDFQSQWHIIDLETQYKAKIQYLSNLNEELRDIEVLIDETKSKLAMIRNGLKKDIEITKEMRLIPSIVALEKALVPLYIESSEILKRFTKSSREYRNIDSQIRVVHEQIKNEVVKAVKTEELELNVLRAKQISISEKIAVAHEEANNLIQKERSFNDLKRKASLLEKNYTLYTSKTEDARIYSEKKKRNLANVSIVERANTPTNASFPRTKLMLVISIVVACFAAIGSPFLLESVDNRIKTSQEVENILSLPVICELPEVKKLTAK